MRLCQRFEEISRLQAESFGAEARIDWQVGYPVTMNDASVGTSSFRRSRCIR